ncbi:hypothetical protein KM043_007166 [Ampulex compressa]|nr:hypothetical protein KM043_007166 [Ampulex compressa]
MPIEVKNQESRNKKLVNTTPNSQRIKRRKTSVRKIKVSLPINEKNKLRPTRQDTARLASVNNPDNADWSTSKPEPYVRLISLQSPKSTIKYSPMLNSLNNRDNNINQDENTALLRAIRRKLVPLERKSREKPQRNVEKKYVCYCKEENYESACAEKGSRVSSSRRSWLAKQKIEANNNGMMPINELTKEKAPIHASIDFPYRQLPLPPPTFDQEVPPQLSAATKSVPDVHQTLYRTTDSVPYLPIVYKTLSQHVPVPLQPIESERPITVNAQSIDNRPFPFVGQGAPITEEEQSNIDQEATSKQSTQPLSTLKNCHDNSRGFESVTDETNVVEMSKKGNQAAKNKLPYVSEGQQYSSTVSLNSPWKNIMYNGDSHINMEECIELYGLDVCVLSTTPAATFAKKDDENEDWERAMEEYSSPSMLNVNHAGEDYDSSRQFANYKHNDYENTFYTQEADYNTASPISGYVGLKSPTYSWNSKDEDTFDINHVSNIPITNDDKFYIEESEKTRDSTDGTSNSDENPQNDERLEKYIPNDFDGISSINPSEDQIIEELSTLSYEIEKNSLGEIVGNPVNIGATLFSLPRFTEGSDQFRTESYSYTLSDNNNSNTDARTDIQRKSSVQANTAGADAVTFHTGLDRDYPNIRAFKARDEAADYSEIREVTGAYFTSKAYVNETNTIYFENYPSNYEIFVTNPARNSFSNTPNYIDTARSHQQSKENIETYTIDNEPTTNVNEGTVNEDGSVSENLSKMEKNLESVNKGEQNVILGKSKTYINQKSSPASDGTGNRIFITENMESTKHDHDLRKDSLEKNTTTPPYEIFSTISKARTLEVEEEEEDDMLSEKNLSAIEQHTETSMTDLLGIERGGEPVTEFSVENHEKAYIDTDNNVERITVATKSFLDTTDAHIISATPFNAVLSKHVNAPVTLNDFERNEETNINPTSNNQISNMNSAPEIVTTESNNLDMSIVNRNYPQSVYKYSTIADTVQNENIATDTSTAVKMMITKIPINGDKNIAATTIKTLQQNVTGGRFLGNSLNNTNPNKIINSTKHTLPFCDNTVLQNTIKTVINNFANEEPAEANDKVIDAETVGATGENLLPEILDIPNLKGILSLPKIESTIIHKVKDLLSKVTEVPKENMRDDWTDNVIKSSLRHMMSLIPGAQTELPPMTMQERVFKDGTWTTHLVTLLPVSSQDNHSSTTDERVRDSIKNFLRDSAVTLQAAKQFPVQNIIVESVKHDFGPEMSSNDDSMKSIDEMEIRNAFEDILEEIEENVKANNESLENREKSMEVGNYNTASVVVTTDGGLKSTAWNMLNRDIEDSLGLPMPDTKNVVETSTENILSQRLDENMTRSEEESSYNKIGSNKSLINTLDTNTDINNDKALLSVRYNPEQQYDFSTIEQPEKLTPVYEQTTPLLRYTEQEDMVHAHLATQDTSMPNATDFLAKNLSKPLDYMFLGESNELPESTELSSLKITNSEATLEQQPETHKYDKDIVKKKNLNEISNTHTKLLHHVNNSNEEDTDIIYTSNNVYNELDIISSNNAAYTTDTLNAVTENLQDDPTLKTFLKLTNNPIESSTTYLNADNIEKANVTKTVAIVSNQRTVANFENTSPPKSNNDKISDADIFPEQATAVTFKDENMEIATKVSNIHTTSVSSMSTDLDEYIGAAHRVTISEERDSLNKSPVKYPMGNHSLDSMHLSSNKITEIKKFEDTQSNTNFYKALLDTGNGTNKIIGLMHTPKYPKNNTENDTKISNMKDGMNLHRYPTTIEEKASTMQSIYTDDESDIKLSSPFTNLPINMYDETVLAKEMKMNETINMRKSEDGFQKYNISTEKNFKFNPVMENTPNISEPLEPEIFGTASINEDSDSTSKIDYHTPSLQDFSNVREITTQRQQKYTNTMRYYQTNPEAKIVGKTFKPANDNVTDEDVKEMYEETLVEKPAMVVSSTGSRSEERTDLTYLGKISIDNNTSLQENLSELQKSELYYIGDGVKLPLEIRKLQDGSYALSLSKKICNYILRSMCPCCVPLEGNITHTVKRHHEMSKRNMEDLRKYSNKNQRKNTYRYLGRALKNSDRRLVRSIIGDRLEKYDTHSLSNDDSHTISMPVADFAKKYNLSMDINKEVSNHNIRSDINNFNMDQEKDKSLENLTTSSEKVTINQDSMLHDKSSLYKEKIDNTTELLKTLLSNHETAVNEKSDLSLNTMTTTIEVKLEPKENDISLKDLKIQDQIDTKTNRKLSNHYDNSNTSNYRYKTIDKPTEKIHFDKKKREEYNSSRYQGSIIETTKKRFQVATMVLNWLKEILIEMNSKSAEKIIN